MSDKAAKIQELIEMQKKFIAYEQKMALTSKTISHQKLVMS